MITIDLQSVDGFGPRLVQRVRNRWPKLLESSDLRDDPYLLTQVHGVGFLLADRVARATGLSTADPRRINAAAVYVLNESENEGHTCLPIKNFLPRLQSALGISLNGEVNFDDRRVILDGNFIARRATDFAEHVVAAKFRALAGARPSRWTCAKTEDMEHFDQIDAILALRDASLFTLMGGPGTGKTWTVKQLIEGVIDFALCAPTGKAAKRLEELSGYKAQTIHRLLGVLHPDSSDYKRAPQAHSHGFRFRHNARNQLAANVVIVDEASMVDVRLMADLCDALRDDARLILVGDPFQLAAVGPGAILRDVAGAGLPRSELTILKRQDPNLLIARNCQQIRYEQRITVDNRRASDFFFLEANDVRQAQALIVDLVTERLPKKYELDPLDIVTITALRERGELSAKALNIALRAKLNPEAAMSPKPAVGDRVIQLSNNYDLEIMNGDIGTLVSIGANPNDMTVAFDTPEREVTADYRDFHIDLAYALTAHKFQGSEAKAVVIAVHEEQGAMVTSAQWLYTAISRARDVCVVVGSRRALEQMAARHRDVMRYTRLAQFLREGVAR